MRRFIIGCITVAFLLPISVVFAVNEKEASKLPPWNMQAHMLISDTCGINCPCLYGLEPHHNHCRFIGGVHIIKGKYGDVSLDGVNWGYLGEFTGSKNAGTQKWLYTAYYIDKNASKAQQKALRAILSAPPFSTLGEQLGIKVEEVKMEMPDDPLKPFTVTIGNLGSITAQPAVGNDPKTPIKVENPVYPFPVKEVILGNSTGKFSDHGKDVDFAGEHKGGAEISEFELSGGGEQK